MMFEIKIIIHTIVNEFCNILTARDTILILRLKERRFIS